MDNATVKSASKKNSSMPLGMIGLIVAGTLAFGMGDCAFEANDSQSCTAHTAQMLEPVRHFGNGVADWFASF